jgi:EAL domain-containing protein (putative c-di-GMP-specific phosphodiesterase class I)
VLDDAELLVTASVGVVVTNDRQTAVESLVRDADVAMYQAKEAGKDRYAIFDERVRWKLQDRLGLVTDLRRAIDARELSVAFQPIVDLGTGKATGVESLLRWQHPARGVISPAEFIPLAEETGTIVGIGAWVLRQACAQLAAWQDELGAAAPSYVSVNLSARQLSHPELHSTVSHALEESGLRGEQLCLELTESVLLADVDAALNTLLGLQELGVRLAIDDFGTGYSSLAYLKRLPVELLKVDRSFVSDLTAYDGDAAIVSAVLGLADAFSVTVVAEGVETTDQLDQLRRLGCPFAQGYHLGRPVTADELTMRLRADAGLDREECRP